MSGSPIKQPTQTIIRVGYQEENHDSCRYTFTGYAEKPQTYTLIIDGAKNLKRGTVYCACMIPTKKSKGG